MLFRSKRVAAKRDWEERLAKMTEKHDLITHECKNKIKEIKEQVEHQVCILLGYYTKFDSLRKNAELIEFHVT